jgi:hypothetical protein
MRKRHALSQAKTGCARIKRGAGFFRIMVQASASSSLGIIKIRAKSRIVDGIGEQARRVGP